MVSIDSPVTKFIHCLLWDPIYLFIYLFIYLVIYLFIPTTLTIQFIYPFSVNNLLDVCEAGVINIRKPVILMFVYKFTHL